MVIDIHPAVAAFIVLVCAWLVLKIIRKPDSED